MNIRNDEKPFDPFKDMDKDELPNIKKLANIR